MSNLGLGSFRKREAASCGTPNGDQSFEMLMALLKKCCQYASTAKASEIERAVSERGLLGLSDVTLDPRTYDDAITFKRDSFCYNLLRKLEPVKADKARRESALARWWEAERMCFKTNQRLMTDLYELQDRRAIGFFRAVRKEVGRILGTPPDKRKGRLRFGPGTTVMHKGERSLITDKVATVPEFTASAAAMFLDTFIANEDVWVRGLSNTLFSHGPLDAGLIAGVKIVRECRWASVSKDVETDRSIGIEATGNLGYQLWLGEGVMRTRLQNHGFLCAPGKGRFEDSQQLHRVLAREGSVTGLTATMDLRMASDTGAHVLVKACMPSGWYRLLKGLRTPFMKIDGRAVQLEKFSSMGNGYTFCLETVIFAALCRVVARSAGVTLKVGYNFSVFGDDIIVPVEIFDQMATCLRYCGFELNPRKSFKSGQFRESCGGNYFAGVDVSTPRIKRVPLTDLDWVVVLNQLQPYEELFPLLKGFRNSVLSLLQPAVRSCRGPASLGDVVLHDKPETWVTKTKDQVKYLKILVPAPVKLPLERWDERTALVAMFYGVPSTGVIPRQSIKHFKHAWIAVSL